MAMASRCIHLCKGVGASVHRHMLSHARRQLCYSCYYPPCNPRNVRTSASYKFGGTNSKPMPSPPNFGIVAALTSNGVIGIDGNLPWTVPIPQDRDHFVNLTRNKILIVGRKTFAEEDPTGAHVRHVRVCIVVSRTMDASDLVDNKFEGDSIASSPGPELKLARSFSEALNLASQFTTDEKDNEFHSEDETINCWVAGGEHIYKEALQHDNATEVHLTHVDTTADFTAKNEVAYFPVEDLERYGFEEVSRVNSGLCSFALYKRQPQKE